MAVRSLLTKLRAIEKMKMLVLMLSQLDEISSTHKLVSLVSAEFSSQHSSFIKLWAKLDGSFEWPQLNANQIGSLSLGAVNKSVIHSVAENQA